jgi:DNA (cytosine-5)-methyltransferase 1
LGYSMAGFHELLAVEWDDNAVDTFRLNFPGVGVYHGDIAKLSVERVLEETRLGVGELDVLDGSPPCQGFSTAGKREMNDPRNQLFREYVRLLRGLQPKCFVMENVSGMVKGKMKLIFAEILRELKASGYRVSARLMNAMYFNVPQSRQRMIFVGVREDLEREPSHPKGKNDVISLRNALIGLSNCQDAGSNHVWINEQERQTKWGLIAPVIKSGQRIRPNGQYIRLFWDRVHPTITKPGIEGLAPYLSNQHCHPTENRTLSIRELARVASFPDSFQFIDAIHHGASRIGNSVPPLFMRAIAQHIREHILGH